MKQVSTLKTRHLLFVFCGSACGGYFMTHFAQAIRLVGVWASLGSFLLVGGLFYALMQTVREISSCNITSYIHEIATLAFGHWGAFFSLICFLCEIIVTITYFFTSVDLLSGLGVSRSRIYGIILIILCIGMLSVKVFAECDFFLTSLKFILFACFITLGLWAILSHKRVIMESNAFFSFPRLSRVLIFATVCFSGIERILNAIQDTTPHAYKRAIYLTPALLTAFYLCIIFIAGYALQPHELDEKALLRIIWTGGRHTAILHPIMGAILIISIFGGMIGNMYVASRLLYGMRKLVPFNLLTAKVASFVVVMLGVGLVNMGMLSRDFMDYALGLLVGATILFYPLCQLALRRYVSRHPKVKLAYHSPASPYLGLVLVCFFALILLGSIYLESL